MRRFRFGPALIPRPSLTPGDGLILLGIAALLYAGVRLGFSAPAAFSGPIISTSPSALPWYAFCSLSRMLAAYVLALIFSLSYGYAAAKSRWSGLLLLPLLDVLQSVPILSFLPVVVLGLGAMLPQRLALELAAVILIFTSQVWNMTFSFYQSVKTLPGELQEAARVFRFTPWLRFRTVELPYATLPLVWNSMMSWAGGWFFLMAAEIFNVGARDFRLPGLGSYLQVAANAGDLRAISLGLLTLVLIIVALDQLVWRPALARADRFKVDTVQGDEAPTSWFLNALSRSWLLRQCRENLFEPIGRRIESGRAARAPAPAQAAWPVAPRPRSAAAAWIVGVGLAIGLAYGGYRATLLLALLPASAWGRIGLGLLATLLRVSAALLLALLWTLPVGVLIGTNRRLSAALQPIVQIVASVPATAVFPVLVLGLIHAPGGLNLAAVLLMLMGTQWYLLFNVIAGTAAIPQDLRDTTALLRLSAGDRWRTLVLPALFPFAITGAITASGGAWNASIVAEHVEFGGRQYVTTGIGALIAEATSRADYPLLLAATLTLVVCVVTLNRFVWRRLYVLAEERYRMD